MVTANGHKRAGAGDACIQTVHTAISATDTTMPRQVGKKKEKPGKQQRPRLDIPITQPMQWTRQRLSGNVLIRDVS